MSHIFISYTHADKSYLDRLVTWFKENDFADRELWYDHNIGGGNNWRDEITTALDEAFAVVVIVSTNSVKSLYCTYEWAYAMGQGIPILPLVFDEVSMADVPTPLASKQFVSCVEDIPQSLKGQIAQLRSIPPQVAAINKIIYDTVYDTHRRYFILNWLGEGFDRLDREMAKEALSYFAQKSNEAYKALETLMIEKAFAFTTKQHRLCWKLVDLLEEFSKLDGADSVIGGEEVNDEWLAAFEYFEGNRVWRRFIRRYFDADLEKENPRLEVMAEMIKVFPFFSASVANFLIHNMNIDRKKKNDEQLKPEG